MSLWLATSLLMACQERAAPAPIALMLEAGPASRGVVLRREGDGQAGYVAGDPQPRILVRAMSASDADARLCSALTARTRAPVPLAFGWPVDSAAPRVALQFLRDGDVQGLRFVVPGVDARYVFEGITRDGARRVSLRWPVTTDPSVRVPVGAPDSLVERALVPSPGRLDSLVLALRLTGEDPGPRTVAGGADAGTPSVARAVPLRSDLPLHELSPTSACPEVTVVLPTLARIDQRVRIPVRSGDVITADATVSDGTVRLAFDEAPPRAESRERQSTPRAAIAATADGRVTLRVRVQVLPRAQAEQQLVLLRLVRSRAP